jgi:hypothetical protein
MTRENEHRSLTFVSANFLYQLMLQSLLYEQEKAIKLLSDNEREVARNKELMENTANAAHDVKASS